MLLRIFWIIAIFGLALLTLKVDAGAASQPALPTDEVISGLQEGVNQRREMRVNTFMENRQQDQSLAIDRNGRILVAWGSRRQEFGTFGVFAQYLDPLGRPLGTEMHINKHLAGHQVEPAVAFGPDGSAWIAWYSSGQDGHLGGIYMRRLHPVMKKDDAGDPYRSLVSTGNEIRVNDTTLGDQFDPVLMVDTQGQVFVAWISDHSGSRFAYGRIFDPDGAPVMEEFRLGCRDDIQESLPSLARLSDDRTAAVWARSDHEGKPGGIHGRIFGNDGKPAGEEFAVSGSDQRDHVEPSIDSNGNDLFVVAWMSTPSDGSGDYQVSARRFDSEGKPLGEPFFLDLEEDGYANGGTAVMAPDGRFLLAYNIHHEKKAREDGRRPDRYVSIRGKEFDRDGMPLGESSRLNLFNDGEQNMQVGLNSRHASWSSRDQLALTWHGNIDGDKRGVGLTLYAPDDLEMEPAPAIEPMPAGDISYDEYTAQRKTPPEFNPNWVDDSYMPKLSPAGSDFGFEAFTSTIWTPPDPDLAVGPEHIVGVVNIRIRFFDKLGNQLLDQDLAEFFGSTSFSFDPIALYDPLVDRYVVASAEHDPSSRDFLNIAISDDNDPNGTWYTYRFETSSYCDYIDFPNLGSGPDAYYITTDCFGSPNGNNIHIFEKAPMLNGDPITIDHIETSGSFASVGSSKGYDPDSPGAYFASAHTASSPNIKLYAVTDPTGSPQLHSVNVNVGPYSQPPDAQQQGTSNQADTIDYRIKNGVMRDGYLYICHNVNGGDGAAKSRWYKIDLRGWPFGGQDPIKVDGGDIDPGYNIDTWFGDINVDSGGNIAMAFNRSSPDELIGVYRTYRLLNDPPGEMRELVEMQTSTTPETGNRWGDYSGLEEDPAQPGSFWNHHEYRTSSWRTWTGHFAIESRIKLTNETALIPGSAATFQVTNAFPGERVWFLYSLAGEGTGPGVPHLGGQNLDILEPVEILGTADADESGMAVLDVVVPGGAPPVQVWFQAVIPRGEGGDWSVLSNVTADTIE